MVIDVFALLGENPILLIFTVIGVGYAITYVFGTLGMILFTRFFPRIAGIDLPAEAAKLARERGLGREGRRRGPGGSLPTVRAYRLPADMAGKSMAQVDAEAGHLPGKVLRIKRGSELRRPGARVCRHLHLRQRVAHVRRCPDDASVALE